MKKIAINIFFFFALVVGANAQPMIVFESETHDFGQLREGQPAQHQFKFTNKGNAPLIISGVRPSCGCTTPTWSKEPIKPGESGFITAEYDSRTLGAFNKSISVWSNAENPNVTLVIKGMVVNNSVSSANSSKLSLVVNKSEINLGKVEKNQWVPFEVEIYNPTSELLQVANVLSNCNCVRIDPTANRTLQVSQLTKIKLMYQGNAEGLQLENAQIMISNNKAENVSFKVSAEVLKSLVNASPVKNGFE